MFERRGSGHTGNTYSSSTSNAPAAPALPPLSNEIRGADIIAEYLVKEKVPFILGYAGHGAINRDTAVPVTGTWQMPPIPEVQPTFGQRRIR